MTGFSPVVLSHQGHDPMKPLLSIWSPLYTKHVVILIIHVSCKMISIIYAGCPSHAALEWIKSMATRLLVPQLVRVNNRENKAPHFGSSGKGIHWWPVDTPQKESIMRTFFHSMTSSWAKKTTVLLYYHKNLYTFRKSVDRCLSYFHLQWFSVYIYFTENFSLHKFMSMNTATVHCNFFTCVN